MPPRTAHLLFSGQTNLFIARAMQCISAHRSIYRKIVWLVELDLLHVDVALCMEHMSPSSYDARSDYPQ